MNICLQHTHLISPQIQIHIKTKHKENRSIFIELLLGTLHDFHYVYCLILQIIGHAESALNLSGKKKTPELEEDALLKGLYGTFPPWLWKVYFLPLDLPEVKKILTFFNGPL